MQAPTTHPLSSTAAWARDHDEKLGFAAFVLLLVAGVGGLALSVVARAPALAGSVANAGVALVLVAALGLLLAVLAKDQSRALVGVGIVIGTAVLGMGLAQVRDQGAFQHLVAGTLVRDYSAAVRPGAADDVLPKRPTSQAQVLLVVSSTSRWCTVQVGARASDVTLSCAVNTTVAKNA